MAALEQKSIVQSVALNASIWSQRHEDGQLHIALPFFPVNLPMTVWTPAVSVGCERPVHSPERFTKADVAFFRLIHNCCLFHSSRWKHRDSGGSGTFLSSRAGFAVSEEIKKPTALSSSPVQIRNSPPKNL